MKSNNEKYRWFILASLFLVQGGATILPFSFGPLAPFLIKAFDISRAQMGLFPTMYYLPSFFFSIPAGWLVDKLGIRILLLVGPGLVGLFFILLSQSSSINIAYFLVFLAGIGSVFLSPTTTKGLIMWFPVKIRATAISIKQSGLTFGSAFSAVLMPVLALKYGWQGAIIVGGFISIVFAINAFALFHEPDNEETTKAQPPDIQAFKEVLKDRNLLLLGFFTTVYVAMQFAFVSYLVLYLMEARKMSVVAAGAFLMVANIGGAGGRIGWGVLSDRLFNGKRKLALCLSGFLGSILVLILAFAGDALAIWLLFIIVFLFGATGIGYNGVFQTFAAELPKEELAATGLGLVITICIIGGFIGPPLFGYIVDIFGSYRPAWLLFGTLTAASALLMLMIRE